MASDAEFKELTSEQFHSLFDILTHRETYTEIEDFKLPTAIDTYGPPFQDDNSRSKSPVLQGLVSKFILQLPGLRDVSSTFWTSHVADLIQELAAAELSESYDKGSLGVRKTLSTAISALIEYPARGILGGFPKSEFVRREHYDTSNADDVLAAWQDCLQAAVYGDLLEEIFKRATETDDLTKHDSLVQAMHEFVIVNLASFMHYTLIISPEGPTLLKLVENVHRLIPYTIVRQTLKIGNVASMISAMMKVVLAKVSVGSVTNFLGLSNNADEGQNLLQQIISQVLNWEKRDLKGRAEKIEKGKQAPPKEVRDVLQNWIRSSGREEHNECRRMSKDQGMSMVAVILLLSSGPSVDELDEAQHKNALEWLALQLAIRDRQEIIKVLCHRNPDHLTAAVYDVVQAYTPMIRLVHQAVNLSDTVYDFERFVTDMVRMCKPSGPKGKEQPPSVEDFVDLLHRHQSSSHKFIHQVCKNGVEVASWWYEYSRMAVAHFRISEAPPPSVSAIDRTLGAVDIRQEMNATLKQLSPEQRSAVTSELASHKIYLDDLHAASAARIRAVIDRTRTTPFGPGAYLARWQHLLDTTPITPATAHGPVRSGGNRAVKEETRRGASGDASDEAFVPNDQVQSVRGDERAPDAPSVEQTLTCFGKRFHEVLSGA